MEKQKERARASHKFDRAKGAGKMEFRAGIEKTEFVGYHQLKIKTKISDILINNQSMDTAIEGQEASIILEVNSFLRRDGRPGGRYRNL